MIWRPSLENEPGDAEQNPRHVHPEVDFLPWGDAWARCMFGGNSLEDGVFEVRLDADIVGEGTRLSVATDTDIGCGVLRQGLFVTWDLVRAELGQDRLLAGGGRPGALMTAEGCSVGEEVRRE